MTLVQSASIIGALLLIKGIFGSIWPEKYLGARVPLFRKRPLGIVLFLLATAWFLYHILHLGEADFGEYKYLLFGLFSIVGISGIFVLKDFLVIRGAAILMILTANEALKVGYMNESYLRIAYASIWYIIIVYCAYLGVVPYRARDFIDWMHLHLKCARLIFIIIGLCGLLLLLLSYAHNYA